MESSLADTYRDVIGGVGFDLGWGRGPDNGEEDWDDNKLRTLKEIVKGGLQQFYNPPPDQSGVSHQWSFLKPLANLTLASGDRLVRLPDDFKGVDGDRVQVVTSTGGQPWSIAVSGLARAKYVVYPDSTGRPELLEIEPIKGTTKERGQRFQFVVWPQADADYTLQFKYSIQGVMLMGELPYAYGGAEHASTIRASCLAWAELHLDDIGNGPKKSYFMERLATSISMDRQKRPQTMGYNSDNSDRFDQRRNKRDWSNWPTLTYNDITYD